MFFGLFGKKKETEMPAEPMGNAGMSDSASMTSAPMGASEEKPMGDTPAPMGAMPDNADADGGDAA